MEERRPNQSRQMDWITFQNTYPDRKIGITVALPVQDKTFIEEHRIGDSIVSIPRIRTLGGEDSYPFITFLTMIKDLKFGRINHNEEILCSEFVPWVLRDNATVSANTAIQQITTNEKIQMQIYISLQNVLDGFPETNSFYGMVQEWNTWNTDTLSQLNILTIF